MSDKQPVSDENMLTNQRTWDEFQAAGLLWWINRILHVFGWAVAVRCDEEDKVVEVFPVRCNYSGFDEATEQRGFESLREHMRQDIYLNDLFLAQMSRKGDTTEMQAMLQAYIRGEVLVGAWRAEVVRPWMLAMMAGESVGPPPGLYPPEGWRPAAAAEEKS